MTVLLIIFIILILTSVFYYLSKHYNSNAEINNLVLFLTIGLISSATLFTVFAKPADTITSVNNLALSDSNQELKNIVFNKVIIVGDSRMEQISWAEDKLNIPSNFTFDAKGGATIDWFIDTGLVKLNEILNNQIKNYQYHVVLNMGVNDIQKDITPTKAAQNYISYYEKLFSDNPNVKFYILSVNPIDEVKLPLGSYGNRRTNERIITFNNVLWDNLKDISNVNYCDSYNSLEFSTNDGLHYNMDTNQDILNYIATKCVKY